MARAGRALLLPRIVPLGDADGIAEESAEPSDLPPAIPPLERRLILTRLVQAWTEGVAADDRAAGRATMLPTGAIDALRLAGDLEGLMDAIATENVPWERLAGAVTDDHSDHFARTLDFVRIAHVEWPKLLDARCASDPVRRRDAALNAASARLRAAPPAGPVIAAGSTGSIPATGRLLAAIASLPRGAVVLPGLDLDLDADSWAAIGGTPTDGGIYGHPQFLLRRLLHDVLGLDRADVGRLRPAAGRGGDANRRALLSEFMRPAETTDQWRRVTGDLFTGEPARAGPDGIAIATAVDERTEALAIAVAIRETLAEPDRTVALVTPDRNLARRVGAELGRWGITAADSAGTALADAPAGRLARLAADAAAGAFHPVALLALLAHPAVRLGWERVTLERATAALEIGVLRGPAPGAGLAGVAAALATREDEARRGGGRREPKPRGRLAAADWRLASDLVGRLTDAFADLNGFAGDAAGGRVDLVGLTGRLGVAVEALIRPPPGEAGLAGADWAALDDLFDALAVTRVEDSKGRALDGRLADLPAFLGMLARDRALPPADGDAHPRVRILGLLEARLLDADRVILAGLDETVWPPVAETDAFLNRPMRIGIGLSPPERRIGQTAHDFVQALGARDVLVTRAGKRDGKPTVPSRFLERLRAFLGAPAWDALCGRGARYLSLAAALEAPAASPIPDRPAPRPGGDHFPRSLSVTEIETLVRDPYAIYARHVLGLDPLDPVATVPGAADRGTIVHDILADFAGAHPDGLGDDAAPALLDFGRARFAPLADAYPELYALWWPAFQRFVPAFLDWERARRPGLARLAAERSGSLAIPIGTEGDAFILRGRADRIEFGSDGAAAIVDFKTGSVPSAKEVAVGFAPQLTLEASMLAAGGFKDVPAADGAVALEYVKIGGRGVLDARVVAPPKGDGRSMAAIVRDHRAGLERTVNRYASGEAAYVSRPYPKFIRAYAPYDHLARVREWLVGDAEAEE